ncbi:MAG: TolC family protein [Alphaproteobacteria bacterium]|nr:TolC family protein [Alphaproteobacteria bacterium]
MTRRPILAVSVLGALLVSGCAASLSPHPAFQDVALTVQERTGKHIKWDSGSDEDQRVHSHIDHLLQKRLDAAGAVQIALLNNRDLQASYASLGMAQADLVQAGLLSNPVVDGSFLWPYRPEVGAVQTVTGLAFNFIELFWKRYKEAIAESALEEVKYSISGMVIDHAARTNLAFIDYVATLQQMELFRQVVQSARAGVVSAKAIREAGNSTPLDFEQQQNVLTQAKLDLANAEAATASARERLNVLMGLTGRQTKVWSAPTRLPSAKATASRFDDIERVAVERSIELAVLQQKIITLGYKYQLTNRQALIPDIGVGAELETTKDKGERREYEVGPIFDVTLPLFDQGQARKARGIMEIRQAQDAYWALAVRIRSAARMARAEVLTAHKAVLYYEHAILPQQARLLQATTQQYNAMQEDVFRLIRAKREQIQAGRGYIDALRSYWRARSNYQQLKSGRLPDGGGGAVMVTAANGGGGDAGGH